jgi:thioredoxin reductase
MRGGGVFHCPFCHRWELRDRPLVVYGRDEVAEQQAALLRGSTDQVTVVDPAEVTKLRIEEDEVRAVICHDGSEVPCDGVLVRAPLRRRGRLAESVGLELTDAGLVVVDSLGCTSVPGIHAAGDIAVAPQHVAVALGSGHLAGVMATREILLARMASRDRVVGRE